MAQRYKLGLFAVVALVALRLGAGWHFYKEGAKKFHDPDFSVGYLFQSAKGPLAELYKNQIPDRFGYYRLNRRAVERDWDEFVGRAKSYYALDAERQKQADSALKAAKESLRYYLSENQGAIDEYFQELKEWRDDFGDPVNRRVDFARTRLADTESKLRAKAAPWLANVSNQYEQLADRLHAIARAGGSSKSRLSIANPKSGVMDTFVKYFIAGIGVLLILGLFTRVAALAAAGFLLSVMATQPPWVSDASTQFFYYQLVEFLAMLVLVAFAAGRYAGLDYVVAGLWPRNRAPQTAEG